VIASWLLPHSQFRFRPAPRFREVCVSKQRSIVCVVAACLLATLVSASAAQPAKPQNLTATVGLEDPCMRDGPIQKNEVVKSKHCRPKMNPREGLVRGGYLQGGYVHLRIAYDYDVEDWQKKAFQGAMILWNRHKDVTGFVFEDTTSATIEFRFQRGAPAYLTKDKKTREDIVDEKRIDQAEETTCAEYVSTASYIWYSPKTMNWVANPTFWLEQDTELLLKTEEFRALANIYAHELGHALRLAHREDGDGKSVMLVGKTVKECRNKGVKVITDIQPEDAANARECACHVRRAAQAPR
jgi:hypothetical protein